MHLTRYLEYLLSDAFVLDLVVDAFRYGTGLDLTGYEDGTENPEGEEAVEAAIVKDAGKGLDGSSFVAVQQWLHDFDAFDDMSGEEQDDSIGRRKSDNEELDDAPESAHVKRTAQESFEPEAFVLRRSMPWATPGGEGGLMFVAFGNSFDAFEAILNRMVGNEDGIADALFNFTRPELSPVLARISEQAERDRALTYLKEAAELLKKHPREDQTNQDIAQNEVDMHNANRYASTLQENEKSVEAVLEGTKYYQYK